MNIFNSLDEKISKNSQWLVDIRRNLHQIPELGFELPKTTKYICDILEELGIEYHKNIGKSGIVANIYGKDRDITIALRGDMDALPIQEDKTKEYSSKIDGQMHACGHDVHTSILLGVAKFLKENIEELPCNVRLIFQPAEETTGGALPMIKDGCLENVDAIFGLHVDPLIEVGKIGIKYGASCASATNVNIEIVGRSCHGAYPSQGIDAVVVACSVVTSLQSIISRNIDSRDSAVLSFGQIYGGEKENIIAEKVVLKGTLRTLSNDIKEEVKTKIKVLTTGIAQGYGAKAEIEFLDGYIALINNDEYVDLIKENVQSTLGKDKVVEKTLANMGVEDFAYYVDKVPGVFFNLGVGNEKKGIVAPLHNGQFDIDEKALDIGTKLQILNICSAYEKLKNK